jgi:outer membrane protein
MPRLNTRDRISKITTAGAVLAAVFSTSETFAADAIAAPSPDSAFDNARFEPASVESKWGLVIGAGALYAPEYEGSADFKVSPIPAVSVTYGDWLAIDPSGLSITVFDQGGLSLAATVGYEVGRDQDDSDLLKGLGDIDFAATVGAAAAYNWNALKIYAEIDQTIEGSESLVGKFGAEYGMQLNDKVMLSAGMSGTLANKKHMQSYFGVTGTQSASSGLQEYKAEAGLKRLDFTVSAIYVANENWFVRGEAGMGILMGDAADSPIVERKTQPSIMTFVGYKF